MDMLTDVVAKRWALPDAMRDTTLFFVLPMIGEAELR